jgi:hypothetical protein
MRSIKDYIGGNNRLYGKKFRYFDGQVYSLVYKICKVPLGINNDINNDTHCLVSWNDDGCRGSVDYTWDACKENIEKGIWILI